MGFYWFGQTRNAIKLPLGWERPLFGIRRKAEVGHTILFIRRQLES
jgi:hypothetical protein